MRIKGHALVSEGAAFNDKGLRITYATAAGNEGRALCECGALSEVLPSGYARRRWHTAVHKPAVRRAQRGE